TTGPDTTTGGGEVVADMVVATGERSCALGTTAADTSVVRCFGRGDRGGLGTAATQDVGDDELPSSSVDVDVGAGVVGVSSGAVARHTCAVRDDAALVCWGANDRGQLGYGHTQDVGDDEVPAQAGTVDVGDEVWLAAAGGAHTCVLGNAGVHCFGAGDRGQLGYAATADVGDDEAPSTAGTVALPEGIFQLAAGEQHSCAATFEGDVYCWGANDRGQLGYGHTEDVGDDETPMVAGNVAVPMLAPPDLTFQSLVVGARHTCALSFAQEVYCWGANDRGQLGYGHTEDVGDDETPMAAGPVPLSGVAFGLVAGGDFTCAYVFDEQTQAEGLQCWGANDRGQLGYGHTEDVGDDETPAEAGLVPLLGGAPALMYGGKAHVCVVSGVGEVPPFCWGANDRGQLGVGDVMDRGGTPDTTPTDPANVAFPKVW
ncbi:MAG: hypothetical protein D6705_18225, partial [Deltaproteobacteria bacterium]